MAETKISHKQQTTAEELLQNAELAGNIRLRLDWVLEVPHTAMGKGAAKRRWRRLPLPRPTIRVRDAQDAWLAIEAVDLALAQLGRKPKGKTTKETTDNGT